MSQTISISALYTYPVKSCAGISHRQIAITDTGPLYDRRWMIGCDSGGSTLAQVTQREVPKLALVQPTITADSLILSAPGMPDLSIPLDDRAQTAAPITIWRDSVTAHDEGSEAAVWFSDFLNVDVRLLRMPDDCYRRVSPEYSPEPAQVGFADAYPLLLISEASLADLNEKMASRGKPSLPMNRFRPSVVAAGCAPFAEDGWKRFTAAGIPFDVVKPCARCVTTTVEQSQGVVLDSAEPLATLATYRKVPNGVLFGQNVVHRALGTLRVGDVVTVLSS